MLLRVLGWLALGLVEPPLVDVPIAALKVVMSPRWIPSASIHPAALETLGFPRAGDFPTQDLPGEVGLRVRGTLEARFGTRGFRMWLHPGDRAGVGGLFASEPHPALWDDSGRGSATARRCLDVPGAVGSGGGNLLDRHGIAFGGAVRAGASAGGWPRSTGIARGGASRSPVVGWE